MINYMCVQYTHLERELENLGFNVKLYRFDKATKTSPKESNRFVRSVVANKPDVLFMTKHTFIRPKALSTIKKKCPKTKIVMWYGDQRGNNILSPVIERVGSLDALLVTHDDEGQKNMYRNAGIPHVYTAYHSFALKEFQLWPNKITHDAFFGGSNFKKNKFPLSTLRTNLITNVHKNCKLVVHGNGWPFKTERWMQRNFYAKELRKAKINLGINHYDVLRYYNRRLFESVASGRMHLTYYIPGMEKHFKNRKHLVWFKSVDEGISLLKYYLKNNAKREDIAKQGRQFFIANHSWPVRAKRFALQIEKILGRRK